MLATLLLWVLLLCTVQPDMCLGPHSCATSGNPAWHQMQKWLLHLSCAALCLPLIASSFVLTCALPAAPSKAVLLKQWSGQLLVAVKTRQKYLTVVFDVQDILRDPVKAADGVTYERKEITDWLSKHDTSPMTNVPMPNKELAPDRELVRKMERLQRRIAAAERRAEGEAV